MSELFQDLPRSGQPYRVLARKYRPRGFEDLIGQEHMVRTLANSFESGRIAQAWMLTGIRGIGKTTTARILARALNYETDVVRHPTIRMDAPGIHDDAIMEGRHLDVVEIDAASHTGIDDVRDMIAQTTVRPASARYKVFVVDEVHMLSPQAFAGLLKTLEEPPPYVRFVFATTEIRKVPVTILSRCQRFDLRAVEPADMVAHLRRVVDAEGMSAEADALALIARASQGSVRDALSLTDQAIADGNGVIGVDVVRDMLALPDPVRVATLLGLLLDGDGAAAIAELDDQCARGADPSTIVADLARLTHLVSVLRVLPDDAVDPSLTETEVAWARSRSSTTSTKVLSETWQMLLAAGDGVAQSPSPRQAAAMSMIRIAYAATIPSPEEIVEMIRDGRWAARQEKAASRPSRPAVVQGGRHETPSPPVGRTTTAAGTRKRMGIVPTSLSDLERLAASRRDARARTWIRRYVRLVRLEPGVLEMEPADGAPPDLAGTLGERLSAWLGERWIVSVAAGGGRTIEEEEAAAVSAGEEQIDPHVATILAAFPGAIVREARIRGRGGRPSGETGEKPTVNSRDRVETEDLEDASEEEIEEEDAPVEDIAEVDDD